LEFVFIWNLISMGVAHRYVDTAPSGLAPQVLFGIWYLVHLEFAICFYLDFFIWPHLDFGICFYLEFDS